MRARATRLWCQAGGRHRDPFVTFAPHPETARLYEPELDVFAVTVTEGSDTPGSYWAWWSTEDAAFSLVFPARMRFPYGTSIEEARGAGRLLPVVISDPVLVPRPPRR